jgi:predicted acetyltransferase
MADMPSKQRTATKTAAEPATKRAGRLSPRSNGVPPKAPHLVEPKLKYVTDRTYTSFHEAVSRGFQEQAREEVADFDRPIVENDRFFGFRVGNRWVSTCGAFTRSIAVPGGADVPVAAVTVVTVHPPFRRRGLLSRMMEHQLEDVARRGEPLAALWASEAPIYGRFGYGPAAARAGLSGSNRRLQFLPGVSVTGSVDEVSKEQFLAVAPALHEAGRPERPGGLNRDPTWWKFPTFDMEFARGGASELRYLLHYTESGDADGFAMYRYKKEWDPTEPAGEIRIHELRADDPGAYAGLWRYLLDLDLARKFRLRNAPVDEPLRHLVTDARAVVTEISDNLYVRVVDVAVALLARRYPVEIDIVIEVTDPLLPANTGRYRLRGGPDVVRVDRVRAAADLSLSVLELGAIYLGGVALTDLHRVGRVTEHGAGAVAAASRAFGWHRAPWCPDNF